ncbi:MAG: PAS domain-containing sensor histidine kinase, partial [bacterium]
NTSVKFLDSIFNVTGVPMFVKDKDHRFVKVNKAFCSFIGLSEKDILGQILDESFPKIERNHFWEIDELVLSTGIENTCEEVITTHHKSSNLRTIITVKTCYVNEQEEKFIVGVIHDITEIKKTKDELNKLLLERDKFFSVIAHDLRSPLGGFLGLTQIMSDEINEMKFHEVQDIVSKLNRSANNLFNLLENLLEWARLQRGMISFNPISLSLQSVIKECTKSVSDLAERKWIEIYYDIPDLIIVADEIMIKSIIHNLISNSVKFTNKRGRIDVSAYILEGFIEISIKDTGIGMSPEMTKNLFNLEIKTNREGTGGESSSGLGLMLCKEFIEKNGGTLRIVSEEGKGSIFSFTIPTSVSKI